MDRFKSVLVDGEAALATMAAYIDLNPVRFDRLSQGGCGLVGRSRPVEGGH